MIEEKRPFKGKKLNEKIGEYTVVDIETTGFSPMHNKIIEIAAVKIKDGKEIDEFSVLVNPGVSISRAITSLTGITNEMVKTAADISSVIKDFDSFVGDSIIVGHNVHFDINFLYDNMENEIGKTLSNDFIDTMYMSRHLVKGLENYKLSSVSKHFDVDYVDAHRAINDCRFTYKCYESLKELL
ncbi:MAG: 3'-5' exonuclease [Clostridia bacterium]